MDSQYNTGQNHVEAFRVRGLCAVGAALSFCFLPTWHIRPTCSFPSLPLTLPNGNGMTPDISPTTVQTTRHDLGRSGDLEESSTPTHSCLKAFYTLRIPQAVLQKEVFVVLCRESKSSSAHASHAINADIYQTCPGSLNATLSRSIWQSSPNNPCSLRLKRRQNLYYESTVLNIYTSSTVLFIKLFQTFISLFSFRYTCYVDRVMLKSVFHLLLFSSRVISALCWLSLYYVVHRCL